MNTTQMYRNAAHDQINSMIAHYRNRMKAEGIKVNVAKTSSRSFRVAVKSYETILSPETQRMILHVALCNRLTYVYGLPIDLDFVVEAKGYQWDFYLPEVSA